MAVVISGHTPLSIQGEKMTSPSTNPPYFNGAAPQQPYTAAPAYGGTLNRTPIVGLKKFRFDDRRCGSFVCVRIEGGVTTTGSGARRWHSSRPEPAGTRSPDGLPCRRIPRETGSGCTDPTTRRRQTLRLGDEGRRGARPRRERHDQDGGHGQARDREHRGLATVC